MASSIKFGTDGWRAIIAEDYTFDNVRLVSQAVAEFLAESGQGEGPIVIGFDTRFGSEHFAQASAEVLAANGVRVILTTVPTPTPAVSLAIVEQQLRGGIVITASHNPGRWNGFKYKPDYGGSAPPEIIAQIEGRLESARVRTMAFADARDKGLIAVQDVGPAYQERMRRLADTRALAARRGTVVYDAMFGAGAGHLPALFEGGQLRVVRINEERNPIFPGIHGPEPIEQNLEKLCRAVPEAGAYLGIATDGDADRVGIVDEHGEYVTQLEVYALLALYLLEVRGMRGPLVKTISQSFLVDRLGDLYGVPVHETPIGFKYVGPLMTEVDAVMGGEESGGYGFRGHVPERDGTVAGLFILDLVMQMDRPLSQVLRVLEEKVGRSYYRRLDLTFEPTRRDQIKAALVAGPPDVIEGVPVARFQTEDGFKYTLEDGSWLLIRFSGTEPIMRVYTETTSEDRVQPMLEAGRRMAGI